MESKHLPKTIEFNRPTKYKALKRLGAGACGETVLIHDENMDCYFVAKKYSPFFTQSESPENFAELLKRFNYEARILFRLNHPNIVRVYSYYDYAEFHTAYILMEYIDGENIVDFARRNPSMLDTIFEKIIDGFSHLEEKNILHRDIRPLNILVDQIGNPKIIDFGFGKRLEDVPEDAGKSITLNWWCETPPEFTRSIYDFQTEVYFVGKLFEQIITAEGLSAFKYLKLVRLMCERNRDKRYRTFSEVKNAVIAGQFEELSFSYEETKTYRNFANALCYTISSIDPSAKYERDHDKIIPALEAIFRQSMLEEHVPMPNKIASAFIRGSFKYWTNRHFETEKLRDFLSTLNSFPPDKQSIVLENLLTRLDSVKRTKPQSDFDDDIPF
ncbi:protein kinase [Rhizobium sp. 18055]|uniref:protein kinase domain-containing protein n=1 Tax=Rhizobium sp. 18055 TaxID=2681403 RepID=UPI00135816C4|nr:protein kinase [Rhizobium sp. 18055]